jgi:antitoxin component of MazEF toxin-antitoxin module
MHIKTIAIKNLKNVVVQIPGFVIASWNLKEGDGVDMSVDENGTVTITPKTQDRRYFNEASEGMVK